MSTVDPVRSAARAATIVMHPMRTRILRLARTPMSASQLARHLGQPRQKVNYHVRQLAEAGFLKPAAQQQKRNMVEQQYIASADSYVLTPEVLGELSPTPSATDPASAAHLLGLCARAQSEVASVMEAAQRAGVRARTMSSENRLHFRSAEERTEFLDALSEAISDVIADYASAKSDASGRPFRLIVGCYPVAEQ